MFTNSNRFDDDIKHEYYTVLYPFLYLKWRFDATISSIKTLNWVDLVCMSINYYFISRQKIIYFVLGVLVGGFYSANLLLANHEREKRYNNEIREEFVDHQLVTCRNFPYEGLFWLTLMGGMQYQTEHHLFPQIPFYNLPAAKTILAEELRIMGKEVKVGAVMKD
jgi:fatty acid desaturase